MLVFIAFIIPLASISADDVYGNYRPPLPILEQIFGFSTNRGDLPIYDYAKQYRNAMNNVKLSDSVLNQGLVFTDAVQRRMDTADNIQYPNQRSNIQNSWMRSYPNNQNTQNNYDGKKIFNRGNHGNVHETQINTQLDDVTRTLVNGHQITTNPRKQDHSTEEDSKSNRNTKPNLLHDYVANNGNRDTTSLTGKTPENDNTNDKTAPEEYNKRKTNTIKHDRPINVDVKYGTKTTQDNEVTPKSKDRKADPPGERWVWSSSEEGVESTTIMELKDRAAFEVNTCPKPKVKVGNRCIIPD